MGTQRESRYGAERDHMHDRSTFAIEIKQAFRGLPFGGLPVSWQQKAASARASGKFKAKTSKNAVGAGAIS